VELPSPAPGLPIAQPPGEALPSADQPPLIPPPAQEGGFGNDTIQSSAKTIPSKSFKIRNVARGGPGPAKKSPPVAAKAGPRPRGEDIIRDTKLKVVQRHYEIVLNEAIQARIARLDATPENTESLKARQAALEEIARNLEEEIRHLSGPPQPNVILSPTSGNLPGVGLADPTSEASPPASAGPDGVIPEARDAEGSTLPLTPPAKEKPAEHRELRDQIGIEVQNLTDELRGQYRGEISGIVVTAVEPGSPADGRIFRGAVIHEVDNVPIDSVETFFSIISALKANKFALQFLWAGQGYRVNIELPHQTS